jgi:hypothetical protein
MAWKSHVLVVANVTADAPELLDRMRARAVRSECEFTLLVPAPAGGLSGREAARARLADALARMRAEGLQVDGRVGDHDPIAAVYDAWDPRTFDEVIVSTLPTSISKWLQVDLPRRIQRLTDATVTHVIAEPPPPPVKTEPVVRERAVFDPFTALTGRRE